MNERVSLFLMDYAHQRRLKVFGRMRVVDAGDDPELAATLAVPAYPARVERADLIRSRRSTGTARSTLRRASVDPSSKWR